VTAEVDVTISPAVEKTRGRDGLKAFGKIDILVTMPALPASNKRCGRPISMNGARCCASISTAPSSAARRRAGELNKAMPHRQIASIAGKEGNPNAAHYSPRRPA